MAKQVEAIIKLQIKAGAANPSPPVGPALGSKGVNIMDFCKQFNARTQEQAGKIIPVIIQVYGDKSFDFITKQPPVAIQLLEVAKIAERHELYIISDEIHADFVYGGKHHTPMASVSEYAMEHTITAFAPSKTFNVAGLCQSYVVIPNKKLYNAYDATYNAFDLGDNVFGMTALTAAYTKGEEWLTEMLQYLEANRDFTVEYIRENIPEISVWSPEGTYLLWLDCSKLNLENDELNQFFLEKAKVKMNPGYRFGAQCSTYMRLNIGCPRAQLQEALTRIEKAIKNR